MKKTYTIIAIFLISAHWLWGQQEALYSQYMFNSLPLNPAYAGSHSYLSASLIARKQWLQIEGAPATQTLSVHAPFYKDRMGWGVTAIHDQIGVTSQTGVYGAWAYRMPLGQGRKLAFALQAGFTNYISKYSQLLTRTPNDPSFASDDMRFFLPNFGTGLYYQDSSFYLGASVPHILDHLGSQDQTAFNARQFQHYFLTAGKLLTINSQIKLKPSFLLRFVGGAPIQLDINNTLILNDVLWIGLSYRSKSSLSLILQAQLSDQLALGYGYDSALNSINRINNGSHELMLNYRFTYFRKGVVPPRYF